MFIYKKNIITLNIIELIIGTLLLTALPLQAKVLRAPISGDQVEISVDSNISFDPNTQLYKYSYTFTSSLSSQQNVWIILMTVKNDVVDSTSPEGWSFRYDPDSGNASWGSKSIDDPNEPYDPNAPEEGLIPLSPFDLKPGQTLSGFSFKSTSGSEPVTFYAHGFTQPPMAENEDDFENEGYVLKGFKNDSFEGVTIGPMSSEAYSGNRRPSVDGFLGFTNLTDNKPVFTAPATIAVEFSLAGEIVDRSSFSATLNRTDVTSHFIQNSAFPGDLSATFELGNSPLSVGNNVLTTTVTGTVPGTSRTASDTDRISFTVQ